MERYLSDFLWSQQVDLAFRESTKQLQAPFPFPSSLKFLREPVCNFERKIAFALDMQVAGVVACARLLSEKRAGITVRTGPWLETVKCKGPFKIRGFPNHSCVAIFDKDTTLVKHSDVQPFHQKCGLLES